MQIKQRTMRRGDWRRILERTYAYCEWRTEQLSGIAGLISVQKVSEIFSAEVLGHELCLLDDGYQWLQVAPENENWWLTVMIDREHRIVQYYFDITLENVLKPEGESYFFDLFLDVVYAPGIGSVLLDEDELHQALAEGVITAADAELARCTADGILRGIRFEGARLEAFCRELLEKLVNQGDERKQD